MKFKQSVFVYKPNWEMIGQSYLRQMVTKLNILSRKIFTKRRNEFKWNIMEFLFFIGKPLITKHRTFAMRFTRVTFQDGSISEAQKLSKVVNNLRPSRHKIFWPEPKPTSWRIWKWNELDKAKLINLLVIWLIEGDKDSLKMSSNEMVSCKHINTMVV